jgi:hypothetical protein
VLHPHGQRNLRRRRRKSTTIPAGVKLTPHTLAPTIPNIRLNAVQTRTCRPLDAWLLGRYQNVDIARARPTSDQDGPQDGPTHSSKITNARSPEPRNHPQKPEECQN